MKMRLGLHLYFFSCLNVGMAGGIIVTKCTPSEVSITIGIARIWDEAAGVSDTTVERLVYSVSPSPGLVDLTLPSHDVLGRLGSLGGLALLLAMEDEKVALRDVILTWRGRVIDTRSGTAYRVRLLVEDPARPDEVTPSVTSNTKSCEGEDRDTPDPD